MDQVAAQTAQAGQQMINLWAFAFVFMVALAGALSHWAKKRIMGEIQGSLVDYLFYDHAIRSGATFGVILTGTMTAAATGAADFVDPRLLFSLIVHTGSVPAVSLLATGAAWQAGWQVDSMVNKGRAP